MYVFYTKSLPWHRDGTMKVFVPYMILWSRLLSCQSGGKVVVPRAIIKKAAPSTQLIHMVDTLWKHELPNELWSTRCRCITMPRTVE